jgi:hypothetical protein
MHKPPPYSGGLADAAVLSKWCLGYQSLDTKNHSDPSSAKPLTASLIIRSVGKYTVHFDGETIVDRSRDPETDLARSLLARGIPGTVTMVDGATGRHRSTINIEKAAKLSTAEGPLRFIAYRGRLDRSPGGEDGEGA